MNHCPSFHLGSVREEGEKDYRDDPDYFPIPDKTTITIKLWKEGTHVGHGVKVLVDRKLVTKGYISMPKYFGEWLQDIVLASYFRHLKRSRK